MAEREAPGKALVVGGSIAGLSCAHALITAGWELTVIEKSSSPSSGSPTGAGLSLDPQAREIVSSWLLDPAILNDASLPLQFLDGQKKVMQTVARDDNFNYRCFHWKDLHSLLYKALPPGIVLWGHQFFSLSISENKASVQIRVKVLHTDEMREFSADLLIAADGSMSTIRQHFLPDHKLRYSGYSAWRGVYDFSKNIDSDTIGTIRRAYPELGKCLYFDLAYGSHCVLFELRSKRLNWIWYFNTPEPDIKGRSVTLKASHELIEKMHADSSIMWSSELAWLIRETKSPFINVIYDSDPLPQLFWGNVVLVGDAAHPITPHCSRSTNMSVLDAKVLGLCLKKWGVKNLGMALQEFQSIRSPVISSQVLHSRQAGRLKQGLPLQDNTIFNPKEASSEEAAQIQHKSLPFFYKAPVSLDL
ncbi:uncharacterized protein LOC110029975 isoform X2 [Phalaenopsis equestris]|uniref:uncharacterized protein LOC110029975 isoform X2 n=1 Tax=Phalaenopsis equestris TaxID=78828 RepID=UPI0009E3ADBA|nr:uncharacterized protein LOC110029975 isoform X2 [Phalaenopsis equestris]